MSKTLIGKTSKKWSRNKQSSALYHHSPNELSQPMPGCSHLSSHFRTSQPWKLSCLLHIVPTFLALLCYQALSTLLTLAFLLKLCTKCTFLIISFYAPRNTNTSTSMTYRRLFQLYKYSGRLINETLTDKTFGLTKLIGLLWLTLHRG